MKQTFFGTDGIRTAVGTDPLTINGLVSLGNALGQWIEQTYGTCNVLIGHDTRQSYSLIKAGLTTGLLTHPITLFDAQVVSTPALSQLVQKTDLFSCGIIISASHNPYQDNGIKLVTRQGKVSAAIEEEITHFFYNQEQAYLYNKLGTVRQWSEAAQLYRTYVSSFFDDNFLNGTTIVIDCAHGANHQLAPDLFQQFGAHTIVINNQPNGININHQCGSVHPEELQQAVLDHSADAGFAFDGDGDRVIAVNKKGAIKNGDDLLALLSHHSAYEKQSALVGTILTNYGLEQQLKKDNKQLLRASVGDKYDAQQLQTHSLLLGGEQSGHIIMRDYLDSGDGIFAALRVLESIIQTNNWDMESFTTYPQIQINVAIKEKKDLSIPPLADIITAHQKQIQGRLIVRYSGTENVVRIMVEDSDYDRALVVATDLSHELQKQLY